MYRVRPYFEIKKVKLPDCMYLMKPLHQLPSMTTSDEVRGGINWKGVGFSLLACDFLLKDHVMFDHTHF